MGYPDRKFRNQKVGDAMVAHFKGLTSPDKAQDSAEIAAAVGIKHGAFCYWCQMLRAKGLDIIAIDGHPWKYWLRREVQAGSIPLKVQKDEAAGLRPTAGSAGLAEKGQAAITESEETAGRRPGVAELQRIKRSRQPQSIEKVLAGQQGTVMDAIAEQLSQALRGASPAVEVRRVTLELSISLTRPEGEAP